MAALLLLGVYCCWVDILLLGGSIVDVGGLLLLVAGDLFFVFLVISVKILYK